METEEKEKENLLGKRENKFFFRLKVKGENKTKKWKQNEAKTKKDIGLLISAKQAKLSKMDLIKLRLASKRIFF
jgi:hypothetical protein